MSKLFSSLILVSLLGIYSTAISADYRKNNFFHEIELVGLGSELIFLFPENAKHLSSETGLQNQYKGTIISSNAVLYPGGTLEDSDCITPFKACGVLPSVDGKFVAEFPEKVIGTSTLQVNIVTDEMDEALAGLFNNDPVTYLSESEKLSGRIAFEFRGVLNFNNSLDYLKPARDTITLHGYILWGNSGEEWNVAITGGTGEYKNIKGEAEFERLTLVNAGGVNSFRIKLPIKKH